MNYSLLLHYIRQITSTCWINIRSHVLKHIENYHHEGFFWCGTMFLTQCKQVENTHLIMNHLLGGKLSCYICCKLNYLFFFSFLYSKYFTFVRSACGHYKLPMPTCRFIQFLFYLDESCIIIKGNVIKLGMREISRKKKFQKLLLVLYLN